MANDTDPMPETPAVKPGASSSEFKITVVLIGLAAALAVIPQVVTSGACDAGCWIIRGASILSAGITAGLAAAGYAVSRGVAKSGG